MPFSFTNSKGQAYILHSRTTQLKNGNSQTIYFFAKEAKDGALDAVPLLVGLRGLQVENWSQRQGFHPHIPIYKIGALVCHAGMWLEHRTLCSRKMLNAH